jgi:NAD(P)-dependent dehydrogenase (short-subunit alcohol dehydrogenase family)
MTSQRIWLITGVSSGFGRELTTQLLERGDRVVGTVRDMNKVRDLTARHPEAFHVEVLDVTDTAAIHDVVDRTFEQLGRIDVVVSNAGYGLFGIGTRACRHAASGVNQPDVFEPLTSTNTVDERGLMALP